jgi:hypothetical protein
MILVALGAMDMMADKDRNVFEMPYDKGEMLNFALYDLHARIEKLQGRTGCQGDQGRRQGSIRTAKSLCSPARYCRRPAPTTNGITFGEASSLHPTIS